MEDLEEKPINSRGLDYIFGEEKNNHEDDNNNKRRMEIVTTPEEEARDDSDGGKDEFLADLVDSSSGSSSSATNNVSSSSSSSPLSPELKQLKSAVKYIPLRLTEEERLTLGTVEGAFDHSEYTSNVDVSGSLHYVRDSYNKDSTILEELNEMSRVLVGLAVANNFKNGGKKILEKTLVQHKEFLQSCMEIGRRYKIMNPDKMRDSYGKLLYMLMDSVKPQIKKQVGFDFVEEIQTVENFLTSREGLKLLDEPSIILATTEIEASNEHNKNLVAELKKKKKTAQDYLINKYGGDEQQRLALSKQDVSRILFSIEDSKSFLRSNRDPVVRLLQYLEEFFEPKRPNLTDPDLNLDLNNRNVKPRHELNHDHTTQFYFVQQSLTLWKLVMTDFFRLWIDAEADLLDSRNGYALQNTGQGIQRCQHAPRTSRNMHALVDMAARISKVRWVGLSVVHLGDREVPNALVFIDKYTQISRILGPVVKCLDFIQNDLENNQQMKEYIRITFGSTERCVRFILADLFRGGFDGGGDLGGSCIDGRLTSLWNWSSLIEKKSYYSLFMISGFIGFDGKF